MKFFPYSALILVVAFAFAACGGSEQAPESEMEMDAMEVEAEGTDLSDAAVSITIQPAGDEMRYAVDTVTVAAGTEVTLIMDNTATAPAMIHNIVVLTTNSDDEATRVGMAAIAAMETDYVPEDEAILAYTPMANPGETVEVTFTAPSEPGSHRFICTYPGHFGTMQGVLIVQ